MKRLLAAPMLVVLVLGCKPPEGTTLIDHDKLPDELGYRDATHVMCGVVAGKEVVAGTGLAPLTEDARRRIGRSARRLKYSHKRESGYLGLPPGQRCYRYFKDGKPNGPWLCVYRAWHGVRCVITDLRAFEWDRETRKAIFTYYGPKNVRFSFGYEEARARRQ
jgi:hypothetical protein